MPCKFHGLLQTQRWTEVIKFITQKKRKKNETKLNTDVTFLSNVYGNLEAASKHLTGTWHQWTSKGSMHLWEALTLLYAFSFCHKHSTEPLFPISEKWQMKKWVTSKAWAAKQLSWTLLFSVWAQIFLGLVQCWKSSFTVQIISAPMNCDMWINTHLSSLAQLTCIKLFIWAKLLFST